MAYQQVIVDRVVQPSDRIRRPGDLGDLSLQLQARMRRVEYSDCDDSADYARKSVDTENRLVYI